MDRVRPEPTETDWQRQEAALREPEAAALRAVLASPPPQVLAGDFATRVAALAEQRAQAPSVWVEHGLAIGTVALLLLAGVLAEHWQPGLWSWPDKLGPAPDGGGWWLTVAIALWLVSLRPGGRIRQNPLSDTHTGSPR